VVDFRPQILFKIKQNVVKTLVNSNLYTIIKKGYFSFLAEKSCLGYSNSEHPDSFHHETTASITSKVVVYAPAERAGKESNHGSSERSVSAQDNAIPWGPLPSPPPTALTPHFLPKRDPL
jgi:hypothetical protein